MELGGVLKRQGEVVAIGVSDGLSKIASTTWSGLREGASDLSENPVSTVAEYAKNHWQDVVAGAAIGIIGPRKLVNTLLIGWSLKGVAGSTTIAMVKAAENGADTSAIGRELGNKLSHEGTAFISAMPMALAGSMVGRAGANAVFGRNMAAYDFAAGKVSREQVRVNLQGMKDAVAPPKVKLVVTDLDGTTWSFADYFAPAMRENIAGVARKTGTAPKHAAESMGTVMDGRRTHEWPWVLEESSLAKGYPGTSKDFGSQVVEPFWQTVDAHRAKYLTAFPEVPGVMTELAKRQIPVVALSDAPMYMARVRIQQTGLDRHIERLYALHSGKGDLAAVRDAEALGIGQQRVDSFNATPTRLKEIVELPRHFEKPEPHGLRQIMDQYNVRGKEVIFIGDSRVKDGGVAMAVGARYIWARYGSRLPTEYEAVMGSLKPPAPPAAAAEVVAKPKVYPPIHAEAASYAEILNHLTPKADYAAIARATAGALRVPPRLSALNAFALTEHPENR